MRRLIIIGIINLCLVAFSIVGLLYFSFVKDQCGDYIEKSVICAINDDKENANSYITDAKNTWTKHEKYLEIFIYHNHIEDVNLNLVQMQALIENKSYQEFVVLGKRTQSLLDGLLKEEIPTISRIL